MIKTPTSILLTFLLFFSISRRTLAFTHISLKNRHSNYQERIAISWKNVQKHTHGISRSGTGLNSNNNEEQETLDALNEQRIKVWAQRRQNIRSTLKQAENAKLFRLENDIGADEEKKSDEDAKFALSLTAFAVAAGAVTLRVGGRAALVSGLGLDFIQSDPELMNQIDSFLNWCGSLGPVLEPAAFIAAWTFVKVFCFDAGGVVLALASGVLFGGVLQGAVISAFGATVGSSVAFGLAKVDTPARTKALELLEEYPSLRGLEKVVAKDGIKAILTLRLAPVLPIPIGLYNYVYGVTNVPYLDFAAGIFLGSLKPYLLDSYLGYFGKSVLDGNAGNETEDLILLAALGVAVLIGVFASQLAGNTFESITEEIEAEKLARAMKAGKDIKEGGIDDSKITRSFLGLDLPQALIGMQIAFQLANNRLDEVIEAEYNAKVWNYTAPEEIPEGLDPAMYSTAPEVADPYGFDFGLTVCEGICLTPQLWSILGKYSDPNYDKKAEEEAIKNANMIEQVITAAATKSATDITQQGGDIIDDDESIIAMEFVESDHPNEEPLPSMEDLLTTVRSMKDRTETLISEVDAQMSEIITSKKS